MVTQQDGTITIFTETLEEVASTKLTSHELDEARDIINARLLTASQAQKSILGARPDLHSELNDGMLVLIAVSDAPDAETLTKNITYSAWAIQRPTTKPAHSKLVVRSLFEHSLSNIAPILEARESSIVSAKFNNKDTALDLRLSNALLRFDLQTAWPRPVSIVTHALDEAIDTIPLSQSYLLAAFPHTLRLIDVNYSSLQSSAQTSLKRKKSGQPSETNIKFINYASGIGRVLALHGQRLVAIDISVAHASQMGRLPASTLAENLGRGIAQIVPQVNKLQAIQTSIGGVPEQVPLPASWKEPLQQLIDSNQITKFEDIIIQSFNLEPLSAGSNAKTIPDELLDYVLLTMFEYVELSTENLLPSLSLRFASHRLLRILSTMGLLRTSSLRRVFRTTNQSNKQLLGHDAVIQALLIADPTLTLAQVYCASLNTPDANESACVLQTLIQHALLNNNAELQKLALPALTTDSTMEIDLSTGDTDVRLSDGLEIALVSSMDKFGSFGQAAISSSLKTIFSEEEVVCLVQLLRQQLFKAGHTSTPTPEVAVIGARTYVSLQAAIRILSACVDTFGPLDLINGGQGDDFVEMLVPDLFTEISLATQYIEEHTELLGILRETLRYAESQQTMFPQKKSIDQLNESQGKGEIVTLYAQRTDDEEINGLPGALPLSLRVEDAINPMRVRRGGGQVRQRSQREMLMLQNRQNGPYTFERLVL